MLYQAHNNTWKETNNLLKIYKKVNLQGRTIINGKQKCTMQM